VLIHPNIDPVALDLGLVKIHWYGIMYLIAFASAWWLGSIRAKKPGALLNVEQISDLIFYGAIGVVAGGRLGYILFYDLASRLEDPISILYVWQGGMSFHGGLIGVLLAMWFFGRKHDKTFFQMTDFIAPLVPLGLCAGRIGNFINGELWGRVSDLPWAMAPREGMMPRHPSQLYEALLEGVLLFIILWLYSTKPRPTMAVSGMFLLFYGLFRSIVEFFRTPDSHIGFLAFNWLTMGQLLSAPMILGGIGLLIMAYKKQTTNL